MRTDVRMSDIAFEVTRAYLGLWFRVLDVQEVAYELSDFRPIAELLQAWIDALNSCNLLHDETIHHVIPDGLEGGLLRHSLILLPDYLCLLLSSARESEPVGCRVVDLLSAS
jgi:hypothetical protein